MRDKPIGLELRCLNNLIMRHFENSPNRTKIDAVTGTNGWIIGYLSDHADEDIYQKDLEKQFTITRSTASKVLHLMEQKGLIERHSVAHDARLKKLVLTNRAKEISQLMRQDGAHMNELLTKGFSDKELEVLREYIKRMQDNMTNT